MIVKEKQKALNSGMEFIDGQLTAGREKLREGKRTLRGRRKKKR